MTLPLQMRPVPTEQQCVELKIPRPADNPSASPWQDPCRERVLVCAGLPEGCRLVRAADVLPGC